jgi:hypothetical protein
LFSFISVTTASTTLSSFPSSQPSSPPPSSPSSVYANKSHRVWTTEMTRHFAWSHITVQFDNSWHNGSYITVILCVGVSFCGILTTLSVASGDRMTNELEMIRNEVVVAKTRCYLSICVVGLRKTTKHLNQDCQWPGKDSKWALLEYKSRALPLNPLYSVYKLCQY